MASPQDLPLVGASDRADKEREKRRARERRARERREATVNSLRSTLDVLEYATLVTNTVGDSDAVWDDFIDDKTIRVRKSLRLAQEAATLENERAELQRSLEEHKRAAQALLEILAEQKDDTWEAKVERLFALAAVHFTPWTMEECQSEIDDTLKAINTFVWSQDKVTSGLTFLGWRETRRVDPVRGEFQFQFSKKFKGHDIMNYVNVGWDSYTHAETYKEVLLGNRLQCTFEVLQQLGPNVMIVRGGQRFSKIGVDLHFCYLVYRMRIENGFLQFVRSIHNPAMHKAIAEPNDVWTSTFIWFRWENLPGGERGYTLRAGGTIGSKDANHLNQWMFEALASLLRSERIATGRLLITSS